MEAVATSVAKDATVESTGARNRCAATCMYGGVSVTEQVKRRLRQEVCEGGSDITSAITEPRVMVCLSERIQWR